ncbi:E3 ubiquitin-protein ligase TRIM65 isoform X3 [Physeter macrocephalus]|uniref:E3 ubiquitin-protein ligase TRIM65 isoform X3 n=1 Tax=Physeter macrocephalus TaxID=9755 RepID=A0A455AW97_PHYMC|nr:tripartite motif-containing protein 65 isoform X3 [Physeter catodon]|eukprot:XP_028340158.1 tripartite motif-containing protein 65 isoform X3 [Physeter catodon]
MGSQARSRRRRVERARWEWRLVGAEEGLSSSSSQAGPGSARCTHTRAPAVPLRGPGLPPVLLGLPAAAMAAQGLEDRLTCAICLELYQDPVTLLCGHNFCRACIQDCWSRREKECPECREPFPDSAELRRNVALSGVLEELRACQAPDPGPGARCPRHERPLELFCRTEGLCVCSVCTVRECRLHERKLLDAERREREAQLRATLEVTQQQATQAESQLQELQQRSSQIQSSACTLTSMISGKFSRLLQALEMQRYLALRNIEVAKTQALEQARDEKQRLQGHLEALSCCDRRIRNLLEQLDDRTFLQESQLLAPPGPLGPLTLPHWDEDQQVGGLKESLSQLCALLLEEGGHPGAPAEAADFGSMEAPGPLAPVPSLVCPLRRKLWQSKKAHRMCVRTCVSILSQPDLRPRQRQPSLLPVSAGPAGKALSRAPGPRWAGQLRALAGAVCPELPGRAALLGGACVQPLGDAGRRLLGTGEAQAGAPHGQHRPRAQLLGALHSGGQRPGLAQRGGPAPPRGIRAAPGHGFGPDLRLPHLLQPGARDPTLVYLPCHLRPAPPPRFLAPRG